MEEHAALTHVHVVGERLWGVPDTLGLLGAVLPLNHLPRQAHVPDLLNRTPHAVQRDSAFIICMCVCTCGCMEQFGLASKNCAKMGAYITLAKFKSIDNISLQKCTFKILKPAWRRGADRSASARTVM